MAKKNQKGGEHEQGHNDKHGSPLAAIELSRAMMGSIDWDPCGNPNNPLFAKVTTLLPIYESLDDKITFQESVREHACVIYEDSLAPTAQGGWRMHTNKFINGPWSDLDPWVERLKLSHSPFAWIGPSRTCAGWFHELTRVADLIWFPKGRFTYVGSDTQPPFHSFMAFRGVDPLLLRRLIPQFFPKDTDPALYNTRYLRG